MGFTNRAVTSNSAGDARSAADRRRLRLLILAAAVLHISVTLAVFTVGKSQLMPAQIDESGLGRFASDGYIYKTEVIELRDVLKNQGLAAWATWPTQLHVRLYSLPMVVIPRFSILAVEPVNLIYYLAILVLVFKLGEAVFDRQAALLAAVIVAIWPSFLLHTTQLLRDPLLISSVLVVMWSITQCLRNDPAWHRGVLLGIAGTMAIVCIRIVRLPMWDLLCVIIVVALVLLLVRSIYRRHVAIGTVCFAVLVIAAVVITPRFQSSFRNQQNVKTKPTLIPEEVAKLPIEGQILARRQGFQIRFDDDGNIIPADDGSKIDRDVGFNSLGDIVRHIPRGAVVGFFAPFPNMWFTSGQQVGYAGRLVSAFETLLTYAIECLALFGLWSRRKQPAAWLLFFVVVAGSTALGLVVTNIGALYRLRYPFWIPLVILGAGGVIYLLGRKPVARSSMIGFV
jgi:hypothetical protein